VTGCYGKLKIAAAPHRRIH